MSEAATSAMPGRFQRPDRRRLCRRLGNGTGRRHSGSVIRCRDLSFLIRTRSGKRSGSKRSFQGLATSTAKVRRRTARYRSYPCGGQSSCRQLLSSSGLQLLQCHRVFSELIAARAEQDGPVFRYC